MIKELGFPRNMSLAGILRNYRKLKVFDFVHPEALNDIDKLIQFKNNDFDKYSELRNKRNYGNLITCS